MNTTFPLNDDFKPIPINGYLSKNDLCNFFRISRSTLNRWIRNGDIPGPEFIGRIEVGWKPEFLKVSRT
ncbi:helix-turn-helix transcriptional regulator [Xenorhabdus bovienii]|uniref:helix-turn-helix transcriptional regulator n=1 Tax=Xenorhabdus bovienii TaxID=40576 RepID=UPI0023B2A0E2|nr:helix-turn-helix domain-containing protein [Xenorhabdus bovienii]MDE9468833.1 helix-turn-helix domain-containing protein [Xenorhabdus bovienii]